MEFSLHPQLEKDTLALGELPLCRVLLMNQQAFPWLILVPQRAGKKELFDLAPEDYAQALQEVRFVAEKLAAFTACDKINIAALGNMVAQLHIHIIARFQADAAWPNPVWNSGTPTMPYSGQQARHITESLRAALNITKM
jgi:diadenosine tetraphosphate (Ap4A) HIT family hydrolase